MMAIEDHNIINVDIRRYHKLAPSIRLFRGFSDTEDLSLLNYFARGGRLCAPTRAFRILQRSRRNTAPIKARTTTHGPKPVTIRFTKLPEVLWNCSKEAYPMMNSRLNVDEYNSRIARTC
jgi:hypothetical protein